MQQEVKFHKFFHFFEPLCFLLLINKPKSDNNRFVNMISCYVVSVHVVN